MAAAMPVSDDERETWRSRAMKRVEERYSWDAVTDSYEDLLTRLARA